MWTEDMIQRLTAHWKAGKTAGEIVKLLDGRVSRNAVLGKASRLGLGARGAAVMSKKERFERICDRVIEGVGGKHESIFEASRVVGMDPDVAQWMWNDTIERSHGGDPE